MPIKVLIIYAHAGTEIQDNFSIPTAENWFHDNEVIFQGDNASCHRVKTFCKVCFFSPEMHKKSLMWTVKSLDLKTTKDLWGHIC